jgi:hypothetical protein
MDPIFIVYLIVIGLILYWAMRGLDTLFKKKRILYPSPPGSVQRHAVLAFIIIVAAYAIAVWAVGAYTASIYLGIIGNLAYFTGAVVADAVLLIFVGWFISRLFKYSLNR